VAEAEGERWKRLARRLIAAGSALMWELIVVVLLELFCYTLYFL
jgi:hypothetical protein